jgi:hypothetical protein
LVNGDSLTGALASNATSSSSVGNYAITQGTLAASRNYIISYVGAMFTIIPLASSHTFFPTYEFYSKTELKKCTYSEFEYNYKCE